MTARQHALPLLLLLVAGLLTYAHTLDAPFQLDEELYIRDNPFVRGGGTFRGLEAGSELHKAAVQRYAGFLTFALNYRLHGLDVAGYHAVNIAIHLANGVLVYLLVLLTFRTPYLAGSGLRERAGSLAFLTALLFVVHPLQTEAVTYVMQRLASLAALFYLLSLVCYIRWRIGAGDPAPSGPRRPVAVHEGLRDALGSWRFWGAVVSALLAMKTKENAVTLPVMIVLYELLFFRGDLRARVVRLVPLVATMAIIPVTTLLLLPAQGGQLARLITGGEEPARAWWPYAVTQSRVLVSYLRMLLLPVGQSIVHDHPLSETVLDPPVLLALLLHGLLAWTGWMLFKRSRTGEPALRVITFGILWFYVTHAAESFVVPLPLLFCEYRVYLPSVGFLLAAVTGSALALMRPGLRHGGRIGVAAALLLAAGLAFATYQRNDLWRSAIPLWEDAARKNSGSYLVHEQLGSLYARSGRNDEAIERCLTALRLRPDAFVARYNLVLLSISQDRLGEATGAFLNFRRDQLAAAAAKLTGNLRVLPDPRVHSFLGSLYLQAGLVPEAAEEQEILLRLQPDPVRTQLSRGGT